MRSTRLIPMLSLLACGGGTVEESVDPGCPTLEASLDDALWTDLALGEAASRTLTLTHRCSAGPPLAVEVVLSAGTGFSTETTSVALEPGASADVAISVTPGGYAPLTGEVVLLSNDPEQPRRSVLLEATVDPDQDGDGEPARAAGGADCDDRDASVNPAAVEVWNGRDDDCDGSVDRLPVDGVEGGWLSGGSYRRLAWLGNLGVDDVDGVDGADIMIGSELGWGYGYVVPGADFRDYDDEAERYASASWSGAVAYAGLGVIGPRQADHTGDGIADLVVHGTDYFYADRGNRVLSVFDGSSLSKDMTPDQAILQMSAGFRYTGHVLSHADMDGDGQAEVIVSNRYDSWSGFDQTSAGAVLIHDIAGETGQQDLVDDREAAIVGMAAYDYLGRFPTAEDLDGDGYDDLIVSATGEDSGARDGGMVYVVAGGATLPDGKVDDQARARIQGEIGAAYLGFGGAPVVADVTGDERPDLVITSAYADTVYVFSDAASIEGEYDADDADHIIEGSAGPDFFGMGLAAGDFDADGIAELAIGAPDSTSYGTGALGDTGRVFVYDLDGAGAVLGLDAASAVLSAVGRNDIFGQTLAAGDLDGDGADELLADAPGFEGGGRLYLLTRSR